MTNMEKITAEDVKQFFNKTFFDDKNKAQKATLWMYIQSDKGAIAIPGMEIHPTATIDEVVKTFHHHLKENGPFEIEQAQTEQKAEAPEEKIYNIERVEYRKNFYFVEQIGEDKYRVFNEERTKEYAPSTPLARGVLKKLKPV